MSISKLVVRYSAQEEFRIDHDAGVFYYQILEMHKRGSEYLVKVGKQINSSESGGFPIYKVGDCAVISMLSAPSAFDGIRHEFVVIGKPENSEELIEALRREVPFKEPGFGYSDKHTFTSVKKFPRGKGLEDITSYSVLEQIMGEGKTRVQKERQ